MKIYLDIFMDNISIMFSVKREEEDWTGRRVKEIEEESLQSLPIYYCKPFVLDKI